MSTTATGAQKPDFQIEKTALALLDQERDRYFQQLLHLVNQAAKRDNICVDGVLQILTRHVKSVLPEIPWEAIHDAIARKDNPPVDQDLYVDWEHSQLQHHKVLTMRELAIVMQRNQALDLVKYAREELDHSRKACDIFEQNSANATELWEILRELRAALELVSGHWQIASTAQGQDAHQRLLAVLAKDDARKAREQKAHDSRHGEQK